jgi:hypothetical protein
VIFYLTHYTLDELPELLKIINCSQLQSVDEFENEMKAL